MLPQIVRLKGMALDLLFPQSCVGCGKEGSLLCPACCGTLPHLTPPLCPVCGRPGSCNGTCPVCSARKLSIDGIRAPFRFDGVIRQAIHHLKYHNLRVLAVPLGRLLADYFFVCPVPGRILVPVPLHPTRLKERGYNQSNLIARELGRIIEVPVIDDCLVRRHYAGSQAKTPNVEFRWRNVSDAFACITDRLKGREVVLIDDVSTSGATLEACAAALKKAGVASVWGLVLAREV